MPEASFHDLSYDDRKEALQVAAGQSGRPAYLLEKDIWVVWTLRALAEAPFGHTLTFKDGTSLSKAYGAIRRFSEDLDITCDIRAIAADLVADNKDAVIPSTRNQERRCSRIISERLIRWVKDQPLPSLRDNFGDVRMNAE